MRSALKWLLGVATAAFIVAAFTWAPEMYRPNFATGGSDPWPTFRIVFFHVPAAWLCVIAFLVSMIWSIKVLRGYAPEKDDKAMASAQLGQVFAILALISGMLWAWRDWGALWNWDPRQSSVLILTLIYAGYFTLRSSIDDPEKRARLAGVYSILAFITVPFLIFVVPRVMHTLHPSPVIPDAQEKGSMNTDMRVVLYSGVFCYLGLFAWVMSIRTRIEAVRRRLSTR